MLEKVDPNGSECNNEDTRVPKKISLRKKFDIPLEHLDFAYVQKCTDVRELEKILKILRSGEEGYFPQLISCVEERIKTLDPGNHLLRVDIPVLYPADLDKEEREHILSDISEWVHTMSTASKSARNPVPKSIFQDEGLGSYFGQGDGQTIPIRGQDRQEASANKISHESNTSSAETTKSQCQRNSQRIKSWEYEKWDKFDVDEELARMEVTDMQVAEWEKVSKPKIQLQQKNVEKLMRNETDKVQTAAKFDTNVTANIIAHSSSSSRSPWEVGRPSFVEELSGGPESSPVPIQPTTTTTKPSLSATQPKQQQQHRRVRIQIEDVNIPF